LLSGDDEFIVLKVDILSLNPMTIVEEVLIW